MWDHSEIVGRKPAEQKQLIRASQTGGHETLSAPEENGIVHRIKSWIPAVSFHVGNRLLLAFAKPLWPLETAPIILVHPALGNSWVAERLADSEEELSSVELVRCKGRTKLGIGKSFVGHV
jgi:hypothetical protein